MKDKLKRFFCYFNAVDYCLFFLSIILNVVGIIVFKTIQPLTIIMNFLSVIAVILAAKGNWIHTLISIIYNIIYVHICFSIKLYGDIGITTFYYIPMLIMTLFFWKKNHGKSKIQVAVKKLELKQIFVIIGLVCVLSVGLYFVLKAINANFLIIDAISTSLFLVSAIITALAYYEQWFFWLIFNGVQLVMWSMIFATVKDFDTYITLSMIIVHFVNSFYGIINWRKFEKQKSLNNKA